MKRFLLTSSLLVAGALSLSVPTMAQNGRYDDDIYSTGESARGTDRQSSSQQQQQSSGGTYTSSSNQRSYSADGYADDGYGDGYTDGGARSYGNDYGSDYVDYDNDYYYATRFRRFSDPFWGRGYWSAFNNPYWYDPMWYDPFWGYNPWYHPGITIAIGTGWGAPYWNSYWGYNTWYGYSGFNSCYGYPAWAGGWGGSPWMGYNSAFYNGYWNGYYAGLNNGYYGGGWGGNGWNGGWRATSYGPRQSLTTIGSPRGVRNAFNGGQRTSTISAGTQSAPFTNPRTGGRREVGNPQPGAGRSATVASPDAVRTAPGSVIRPERGSFGQPSRDGRTADAVAPASADRPTRFDRGATTAPATGERTIVRDRYQTPDRVTTDAPMPGGRDADAPVRTAPRYQQPRTFERAEPATRPSFGGDRPAAAPVERPQPQRSFDRGNRGGFFNGGGGSSERPAPPVRSAPRYEAPAPRYEQRAPAMSQPRYQSAPRMSAPSPAPAPSRSFGGGNSGGAAPSRGGGFRR